MTDDFSIASPDRDAVERLQSSLGLHAVTASCLVSRGIAEVDGARDFLAPRLGRLRPPHGLAGLDEALPRLQRAIAAQEIIGVFGDYDVDGVTTATLLSDALEAFGSRVVARAAHRHAGYGFGVGDARALIEAGATLIVTGDCGTSDLDAIECAREAGVDVIIIDHHTVPSGDEAHPALALINPFRPESTFPFRGMASVGLAFYVMTALRTALRAADHFGSKCPEPSPCDWLDLVALGTVADLVPLSEENRILTRAGLAQMQARKRPGLAALLEMAGVKGSEPIDERTIGWKLGPRINAPGRLGDAKAAFDLLRAKDRYSAQAAARVIETINDERRTIQERVHSEALAMLGDADPGPAVVVAGEGWPHGVVGIIASRLVDKYQRPAFVIGIDEQSGEGRGSARSVGGVNLYDCLHQSAELLTRYGGHAAAAGFSVARTDIDALREGLHGAVAEQRAVAREPLACDAEIPAHEVDERLAVELATLAPFGKGNEQPILVSRKVAVKTSRRVGDGSHLKLTLSTQDGREIDAIAFGMGDRDPGAGATVDLAYAPGVSTWAGRRRLELTVKELRVS